MQHFGIRYHDGKTSHAYDATLSLMPGYWNIHFLAENEELISLRWELAGIVPEKRFTNLFIFRYGEFPRQTIECADEQLPGSLRKMYPDFVFIRKKTASRLFKSNFTMLGFLLALLAVLVASYVFVLPFLAEKIAQQVPASMETSVGETLYSSMMNRYEADSNLTVLANDFAGTIDFKTHYPIKVTVVKEEDMNAFALPGGNIVVFDGLLKKMKTKEEFAALLSHEVSHVHYQHSLRSIFRSLGGYLFVSLIINDISGIVAVISENSNMLLNLTYSRALETEADQKAVAIFRRQGIGMKGFVDLFKLLQSAGKDVPQMQILSTHPLTEDRMQYAAAAAREQTGMRNHPEMQQQWQRISSAMR